MCQSSGLTSSLVHVLTTSLKLFAEFIFDFQRHIALFFKKNPKYGRDGLRLRDARVLEYSDPKHVKVKYSMSSLECPRNFILDKLGSTVVPSLLKES